MKKTLFILIAVAGIASVARAGGGSHPDAGCGQGTIWFPENKPAPQLVASFTNEFVQSFAITTGTSGCSSGGLIKTSMLERMVFVATNLRALEVEMAAGQGEYVSSLAALSGCKTPEFSVFAKSRYEKLLPSEKTSSTELLDNLDRELATDPEMAKACGA